MRVIVCGGRLFADRAVVFNSLDHVHRTQPITELAEGGAQGADRLARIWARAHNIPVRTFHADWIEDGRSAGALRNVRMIEYFKPHFVVAFPGGSGTAHMIGLARKRGVPLILMPLGVEAVET